MNSEKIKLSLGIAKWIILLALFVYAGSNFGWKETFVVSFVILIIGQALLRRYHLFTTGKVSIELDKNQLAMGEPLTGTITLTAKKNVTEGLSDPHGSELVGSH